MAKRDHDAACGSGATGAISCADRDGRTHDKRGTAGCDRVITDGDEAVRVVVHVGGCAPSEANGGELGRGAFSNYGDCLDHRIYTVHPSYYWRSCPREGGTDEGVSVAWDQCRVIPSSSPCRWRPACVGRTCAPVG
jgi:hypothetical protein